MTGASASTSSADVSSARPVNVFVARRGNAFMTDIASWIAEAARLLGRDATVVADGRTPADLAPGASIDLVVAPHEFYVLSDADDRTIEASCRRSVPVATEQPGTPWFDMTELLCRSSEAVIDINPHGVEALRAAGHDARHLRLGGVPSMDRRRASTGRPRPIDVLFLGGRTGHREARLAELGPLLWDRAVDLRLFSFSEPVHGSVGGLVFGRHKYDLLASASVLLNVHRSDPSDDETHVGGYFEWARMIEAMANGVAVLTEPASGFEPLVPGEHFLMSEDLPDTLRSLLDDPALGDGVGSRAADAVLGELALVHTLGPALEAIESDADLAGHRRRRLRTPGHRARLRRAAVTPLLPAHRPHRAIRSRVQAAWAAEGAFQRDLDAVRCLTRHGTRQHVERTTTSAYEAAEPEVSVVITLYDYASVVGETLASVAASRDVEVEILVVDDHSNDDGRAVVRAFMEDHDHLPMQLVASEANRGLPASRNLGFESARASKVMVLDADNLLYPTCLRRLADALDRDPDAVFSYAILEEFGARRGLQSAMGWHVPWLCEANYIDAQAMIRRTAWRDAGGYRDGDPLMFGWEDWELWLRFASMGWHGAHVAQILGRYRAQETSMIATSNLFGDLMLDHLESLHPGLPWPSR